jgi:hypothetical protein
VRILQLHLLGMNSPVTAPSASKLTATVVNGLWNSFASLQETRLTQTAKKAYDDPANRPAVRALWKARFLASINGDKKLEALLGS